MKKSLLTLLLILLATSIHAKVYKWVDKNGTVHFSDKPYSQDAKEVKVQGTGISINKNETQKKAEETTSTTQDQQPTLQRQSTKGSPSPGKPSKKPEEKVITEADYRVSSSVGKLGADIVSISGRISSGPACEDMTITATATNDNGLSATVTDNIRKPNSFGSTIFEGNAKVAGSADDYGFWSVDSIKIRCNDVE